MVKRKPSSLVDDPSFFLSQNGQRDSGAELDAMLVALAQELASSSATDNNQVKTDNNNSVLCRFPARVAWLTEVLAIDAASLSAECPELDEWMSTLAPEQLSIMFAQEYSDESTLCVCSCVATSMTQKRASFESKSNR